MAKGQRKGKKIVVRHGHSVRASDGVGFARSTVWEQKFGTRKGAGRQATSRQQPQQEARRQSAPVVVLGTRGRTRDRLIIKRGKSNNRPKPQITDDKKKLPRNTEYDAMINEANARAGPWNPRAERRKPGKRRDQPQKPKEAAGENQNGVVAAFCLLSFCTLLQHMII
jgi:hypothetical protein